MLVKMNNAKPQSFEVMRVKDYGDGERSAC